MSVVRKSARDAVRTLDGAAALAGFHPQWNEEATAQRNLYVTYEWTASLWESHFDSHGVEFLLLGEPWTALVPLAREAVKSRGLTLNQCLLVTYRY